MKSLKKFIATILIAILCVSCMSNVSTFGRDSFSGNEAFNAFDSIKDESDLDTKSALLRLLYLDFKSFNWKHFYNNLEFCLGDLGSHINYLLYPVLKEAGFNITYANHRLI